jgi:hypothetical protein
MLRMTNSAPEDGELTEIQTVGSEGIEKNAAGDYPNAPGRYRLFMRTVPKGKPPVATRLDICTTIEVTTLEEARMTSMRVDMQSVRGQSEYNNGAEF